MVMHEIRNDQAIIANDQPAAIAELGHDTRYTTLPQPASAGPFS